MQSSNKFETRSPDGRRARQSPRFCECARWLQRARSSCASSPVCACDPVDRSCTPRQPCADNDLARRVRRQGQSWQRNSRVPGQAGLHPALGSDTQSLLSDVRSPHCTTAARSLGVLSSKPVKVTSPLSRRPLFLLRRLRSHSARPAPRNCANTDDGRCRRWKRCKRLNEQRTADDVNEQRTADDVSGSAVQLTSHLSDCLI